MPRFLNPYNFVRWLDPPTQITNSDEHLLWRCPPPPHDRYTGLSGRIECRLVVHSPLFVSDPVAVEDQDGHKIVSFFTIDEQEAIPATSLRGMIRSVFEAATNSTMGVFNTSDEPLFYRMPPEKALGLVPAILVPDDNGRPQLQLLPGMHDKISIASKNLYAAWIPRYRNTDKLKLSDQKKRHVLSDADIVDIPPDCRDESACWAAVRKTINNQDKGFPHWQTDFIHKQKAQVEAWQKQQPNRSEYAVVEGYVYQTGLNIDLKQYERFFFTKPGSQPVYASLNPKIAKIHNALLDDYARRAEEIQNSLNSQAGTGRKLAPSSFIRQRRQLRYGSLVYAELEMDGHKFRAKALYPVNVSRTAYAQPVKDLLPKHLYPATDLTTLCLASRVFGWVHPDADTSDLSQRVAYGGRVRFSTALIDPATRQVATEDVVLSILGTPHPTALEFYLDNLTGAQIKPRADGQHGYNVAGARLKGRKFYRYHPRLRTLGDLEANVGVGKFNRTIRGTVLPTSTFDFTIDFDNLQAVELGALLWSIELNAGMRHRLGYAKPLGLGSVQIEVVGLGFYDQYTRYTQPIGSQEDVMNGYALKTRFVELFQQKMASLYRKRNFAELVNIRDLQALLGETRTLAIHYPRLPNVAESFKWFMENKKANRPAMLLSATEDESLPDNPRQA